MMLKDKVGVIFGVANKRSIAWACAQACAGQGARMAFSYQSERLKESVDDLAGTLEGSLVAPCDVADQAQVDGFFAEVGKKFGRVDFIVHSIAFAPKEALEGRFIDTEQTAFRTALEISAFSLTQLARAAAPLMTEGGSIVTMSYYGAEKVVPNYNVMGVAKAALEASTRYLAWDMGGQNVRVNAISAGPINTLSARGVKNMGSLLGYVGTKSPLGRNVSVSEVGSTALFLVSDMSSGITGETIYVDCGYNIMGI
jgi:enoyl-[acyl-carrier protein] reductase I